MLPEVCLICCPNVVIFSLEDYLGCGFKGKTGNRTPAHFEGLKANTPKWTSSLTTGWRGLCSAKLRLRPPAKLTSLLVEREDDGTMRETPKHQNVKKGKQCTWHCSSHVLEEHMVPGAKPPNEWWRGTGENLKVRAQ